MSITKWFKPSELKDFLISIKFIKNEEFSSEFYDLMEYYENGELIHQISIPTDFASDADLAMSIAINGLSKRLGRDSLSLILFHPNVQKRIYDLSCISMEEGCKPNIQSLILATSAVVSSCGFVLQ